MDAACDLGRVPANGVIEDFLIATCPTVDRSGLRKVHRQRGVKVNELLYWHADFADPRHEGLSCVVRYDPWVASSVYVRLKDRWVRAQCRNLMGLGQVTEMERRALTEEYTHKSGTPMDDARAAQRLRELMEASGTFTAAQAAQKMTLSGYNGGDGFTAAQAAQKITAARAKRTSEFTAAQAAQKCARRSKCKPMAFTAAQAAQKSRPSATKGRSKFTAAQAAQKRSGSSTPNTTPR